MPDSTRSAPTRRHRWCTTAKPTIRGWMSFLPACAQNVVLLLIGLLAAALAAGIAGLAVGIPSLRLRGDYLAIVTLGFGEIIRVLILNIDAVGGVARVFWEFRSSAISSGSTCLC